jgi:hypothetical protein
LKVNLDRGKLIGFRRQRDRVRDTFSDTEVDLGRKLIDCGIRVVEAVGIEPSSERPVSHDSIAITQERLDAGTPLERSESELRDQLGTRVPNFESIDDLSAHVRRAWGALRVV